MFINVSNNKSKKPRGRPKKAKVVQSSFALGGELVIDFAKVVSSHLILKIKLFLIKEYYNDV